MCAASAYPKTTVRAGPSAVEAVIDTNEIAIDVDLLEHELIRKDSLNFMFGL